MVKGLFKLECPDSWDKDYFLNVLVDTGYIVILDTACGVLALKGSLNGYNYQNIPTKAVVVAPLLKEMDRTIGEDCEVIYLERQSDRTFYTFNDIIRIYAEKLASCDAGIDVNIMNSKLAYLAEAESKAQAETLKKLFDNITDGDPLVVYRKDSLSANPMNIFFNNLKQNFIAIDLQDAKRSIINEFLTAIGVNNANTDKKERLLTSEVDANNDELLCNTSVWRSNLETCLDKVNKMFPELNLKLELQFGGRTEEGEQNDVFGDSGNMGDKKSGS